MGSLMSHSSEPDNRDESPLDVTEPPIFALSEVEDGFIECVVQPPAPQLERSEIIIDKLLTSINGKRVDPSSVHIDETSDMARGTYGEVRRATLEGYPSPVAVKELRPRGNAGQRRRLELAFARELRVWQDLDHPNILPLVAFHLNSQESVAWFISPFMTEGNSREYLDRTKPVMSVRLQLATDSIAGLSYLHSLKICHGDIKSGNVLICISEDRARALLCDFGLAKISEADPSGLTTSSFNQAGSPRYMSPELYDAPIRTKESDMWAWGCILFEMTTDSIPYAEASNESVILKVATGALPAKLASLPDAVPEEVQYMMECCWAQAAERPTAQECLDMLTDITSSPIMDEISEIVESKKRIDTLRKAQVKKGLERMAIPGYTQRQTRDTSNNYLHELPKAWRSHPETRTVLGPSEALLTRRPAK